MEKVLTLLTEQEESEYNAYLIETFIEQESILAKFTIQLCRKCNTDKSFSEFSKDTKSKFGIKGTCKSCQSAAKKAWVSKNNVHISARNKAYRQDNRNRLIAYKKNWMTDNRVKATEYERVYRKNVRDTNLLFKLAGNVSNLVRGLITNAGFTRNPNVFKILGCDWIMFKNHIESQFQPGMSWENRSDWHLDHIYPISAATTRREVFKLSNYRNFRPMWKKDNILKSNNFIAGTGVLICDLFKPNLQEKLVYQLDDMDSLVYHQEKMLMNYYPAEKGALNKEKL